jgi:hypothetical protein
MTVPVKSSTDLRLAELMAALSLATDLGMGQPLEQALRTCLIALRVANLAKMPAVELPAVYYGALLRFLGCTADRYETARVTGDDIAFRRALAPVFGAGPPEIMRTMIPAIGRGQGTVARVRLTAGFLVRGIPVMREGVRAHCEVGEAQPASACQRGFIAACSTPLRAGMGMASPMASAVTRSPRPHVSC